MATIKRRYPTYLLVTYRPTPGAKELSWRCPDDETFEKFNGYEKASKQAGLVVEHPAEKFGEVPKPVTKRAARRTRKEAKAEQRKKAEAQPMTLARWVGKPTENKPGPMFDHMNSTRAHARDQIYEREVRRLGELAHKPMAEVSWADAQAVLDEWLVCPACRERAERAGNREVLDNVQRMSVAAAPWDGNCFLDDGAIEHYRVSTHYATVQRDTMDTNRKVLAACWTAAQRANSRDVPEVIGVNRNPFAALTLPRFADPEDNDDLTQALNHTQLERLQRAMPQWCDVAIPVAAYGMMRRSELLGLMRANVRWPEEPDQRGQAVVVVTHVYVHERGASLLRPWGKTVGATREPIYLTASATSALRDHFDRCLSTPNPTKCSACGSGVGEHLGPPGTNPHRHCDFADGTPLFRVPATGLRPTPGFLSDVVASAAESVGLTKEKLGFKFTIRGLRATGATLLLEAGVEPELVRRMGRWANLATLFRHYYRIRDESKMRAARQLDWHMRGELGLDPVAEAPPEQRAAFLGRRVESLEARVVELEGMLRKNGLSASVEEPIERVRSGEPRRTAFTDEAVIAAVRNCSSRLEMLERIGVAPAKKNYERLERRAAELGLDLPRKWQQKAAS